MAADYVAELLQSLEEQLEAARSALREIAEIHETGSDGAHVCAYGRIARAALSRP